MSKCKVDFIFVVSPDDESGKTTFAEAMAGGLGLEVAETGNCIDEPLARVLATNCSHTTTAYQFRKYMARKKRIYRELKRQFADEMCRVNPAWMIGQCIGEGAQIIVGCRRAVELRAWIASLPAGSDARAKLFIIYRPKPGQTVVPATEFLAVPLPIIEIANDGSVEQLIQVARAQAELLRA